MARSMIASSASFPGERALETMPSLYERADTNKQDLSCPRKPLGNKVQSSTLSVGRLQLEQPIFGRFFDVCAALWAVDCIFSEQFERLARKIGGFFFIPRSKVSVRQAVAGIRRVRVILYYAPKYADGVLRFVRVQQ